MMRARLTSGSARKAVVILGLFLAGILILLYFYTREQKLNGLLVDLELGAPDPSGHSHLQHVLTHELQAEIPSLKRIHVTLNYVHFADLKEQDLDPKSVDFVILSPQSTPWHKYGGEAGRKLESAEKLVKDVVLQGQVPILGICGGHQFLALAFGGWVDFIDPNFIGSCPDRYPKEAASERGEVTVQILKGDPIFAGLVEKCDRFTVMESHHEEVKIVPKPFVNLAKSALCEAQLMRIPGKPVYGVAFHPERCPDRVGGAATGLCDGRQILANFLRMASNKGG
jgi:GMP synthase-like glutamine amidotransferase